MLTSLFRAAAARARFAFRIAVFTFALKSANAQYINTTADIQTWVGSGTNSATLVVDWNDGKSPESIAWGYRWDGIATGLDMLQAIVASDNQFGAVFHPSFANVLFGLYYDLSQEGSGFTPGTPGDLGGPENGSANPPDHYAEGWFTGYWQYFIYGGEFTYDIYDGPPTYAVIGTGTYSVAGTPSYATASANWFSSPLGAGTRELVDGAWDAYSFAPGFTSSLPDQPFAAPVPEPGSVALVVLGLSALVATRRYLG